MSERLAGRKAIITGGAGGIGAATCQVFCEEGARVAIVDRDEEALAAAAADVRANVPGAEVLAIAADLSTEEEAIRVVTEATEAFGGLDILINVAGIRSYEPLAEAKAETWRRIIDINLLSYAYMAKAALPEIRRSGKGSIVNISSTYGVSGRAGMGQYDATKAAIIAMSRTLAFEEVEHGVRVNSLCPGYTMTPFHIRRGEARGLSREETLAEPVDDCLMRRWADPREIALPILWLASDEASYVTAANFMIDGGRPIQ
ncbi:SDR family oxidoreductase [Pikeienuella sp. HZG-20]|uniref:SDR family NAD(P)-dependent oxidoreductase n=1 Tax=Paludibacillus litoralis TaxID=3133267 RepID=UPI0030EF81CC